MTQSQLETLTTLFVCILFSNDNEDHNTLQCRSRLCFEQISFRVAGVRQNIPNARKVPVWFGFWFLNCFSLQLGEDSQVPQFTCFSSQVGTPSGFLDPLPQEVKRGPCLGEDGSTTGASFCHC